MKDPESTTAGLAAALQRALGSEVSGLRRLSGGASQETWMFTAAGERLVLRRAPGGGRSGGTAASISLAVEAKLLGLAMAAGVPVPSVRCVLAENDGAGFVMEFVEGETIPRKILRDDTYAKARTGLAAQCGAVLAGIHGISPTSIPELKPQQAAAQVAQYREIYDSLDDPRPVFELAFRWLNDHLPCESTPTVVHGDFRNGNLIVGLDGLRAVLDWELAHVGDRYEDFGWICVRSWRFGRMDLPVGGFGSREDLYAAYEVAGGVPVDPRRVHFWEVFGTLKWGVICMMMFHAWSSGLDRSVERATIGRRTSETEIDLLTLLAPRGSNP